MRAFFKYAIVLASGVAVGWYIYGTPRLARIDEINILVSNNFAHLRPEATVILDDPTDERRVDEDLDYLIANRTGTLEGWQAFLAAHANGAHAKSAEAEIDKLSLLVKATHTAAAEVSDRVSPEAKLEGDIKRFITDASGPSKAAAPPLHEVCYYDGDCQEAPRHPSSNEIRHPTSESALGILRLQVADLTVGSDTGPARPIPSAKSGPERGENPRATTLHRQATVSSHIVPVHHQRPCTVSFLCHWKTQPLPPILMALLGVKTKHSRGVSGQAFADPRASDLRGRSRLAFNPE